MRIFKPNTDFRNIQQVIFVLLILALAAIQNAFSNPSENSEWINYKTAQLSNELILKIRPTPYPGDEVEISNFFKTIPQIDSLLKTYKLSKSRRLFPSINLVLTARKKQPQIQYFHLQFSDSLNFKWAVPFLKGSPQIIDAEPNIIYFGANAGETAAPKSNKSSFDKFKISDFQLFPNQDFLTRIAILDMDFDLEQKEKFPKDKSQKSNHQMTPAITKNSWRIDELDSSTEENSDAAIPLVQHGPYLGEIISRVIETNKLENHIQIIPINTGARDSFNHILFKTTDCSEAIIAAIEQNAQIILLPWSSHRQSFLLNDAVAYAARNKAALIAAAGNENSSAPHYPAAFDNVLAVTAVASDGEKMSYANFGKWIDISAAGACDLSGKSDVSGTSISSALAAGVAGLVLAENPELSPLEIRKKLIFSAENIDHVNSDFAGQIGAGRINAKDAVEGEQRPNIVIREVTTELSELSAFPQPENLINFKIILDIENIAADAQDLKILFSSDSPEAVIPDNIWHIGKLLFQEVKHNRINPFEFSLKNPLINQSSLPIEIKIICTTDTIETIPLTIDLKQNINEYQNFIQKQKDKISQKPEKSASPTNLPDNLFSTLSFSRAPGDTTISTSDSLTIRTFFPENTTQQPDLHWRLNGFEFYPENNAIFRYKAPREAAVDTVRLEVESSQLLPDFTWIINVIAKNQPPEIIFCTPVSDTSLVEGDSLEITISASDPENDFLNFTWEIYSTKEKITGRENLTYIAPLHSIGEDTVKLLICDGDTCISHVWQLKIIEKNNPPFIRSFNPPNDWEIEVKDSLQFTVTASDSESAALTYYWYLNSIQAESTDDSVYLYRAKDSYFKHDTVQVLVSDGELAVQQTWFINNIRPKIEPTITSIFPEDTLLQISEGDSLRFSIEVQPEGNFSIQYNWQKNDSVYALGTTVNFHTFCWDFTEAGFDTISVQVSNRDTTTILHWFVDVKNINLPPQILNSSPAADTTLFLDDTLSVRLEVVEPDSQALTIFWFMNSKTDTISLNKLYYRFPSPQPEAHTDTLMAVISDGDTMITRTWRINFRKENHAPEIIYFWPTQDTSLVEGDSLLFRAQAEDSDADSLTVFWTVNHDTIRTDEFKYFSTYNLSGADTVEVRISDLDTTIVHRWLVHVENINHLPSIPMPCFPINSESIFESDSLIWHPSLDADLEDSLLTYLVFIAEDTGFTNIVSLDSVKTDTAFSVRDCSGFNFLESGKTYYWQVRAFDLYHDSSGVSSQKGSLRLIKTSAKISNAYANPNPDGSVTIFWETSYEDQNQGFNVLRKVLPNGKYIQLNEVLIRGSSPYSFLDRDIEPGESYIYTIESVSTFGFKIRSRIITLAAPIPETFELHQNYPNPLTFETNIHYQLPRKCQVKIQVYNILGKVVRTLVNNKIDRGFHQIVWNGRDDDGNEVGSGIYFYTITAEKFHDTRKLMVVR